jgi:hypothetical protein
MDLVGAAKQTAPQNFQFEVLHDYEIRWMTDDGTQHTPRISRMGYIGSNRSENKVLLFDARGPNRRRDGEFAGMQAIERRWIISVQEVPRNPALRYAVRQA